MADTTLIYSICGFVVICIIMSLTSIVRNHMEERKIDQLMAEAMERGGEEGYRMMMAADILQKRLDAMRNRRGY